MMLSEKTFESWRIDFGEKVTSSVEAMLKDCTVYRLHICTCNELTKQYQLSDF